MKKFLDDESQPSVSGGAIEISLLPASDDESLRVNLTSLMQLANTAYDNKERKYCLSLTTSVLKIDPTNSEAQLLQSKIHSDVDRALQRIRGLVGKVGLKDDESLRKEALRVLQGVLDIYPDNLEATELRSEFETASQTSRPPTSHESRSSTSHISQDAPVVKNVVRNSETNRNRAALNRLKSDRPDLPDLPDLEVAESVAAPEFVPAEFAPANEFQTGIPWRMLAFVIVPAIFGILILVFHYATLLNAPAQLDRNASDIPLPMPGASGADQAGAPMHPQMGSIKIKVNDGVQVFMNERFLGTAPIPVVESNPGVYHLIYKFGATNLGGEDVTVTAGTTVTNSLHTLLGRLGFLVVPATGVAMHIDNGSAKPIPAFLDLKPGKYRITFTASNYRPETISISVSAGGSRTVSAILKPAALPRLSALEIPNTGSKASNNPESRVTPASPSIEKPGRH